MRSLRGQLLLGLGAGLLGVLLASGVALFGLVRDRLLGQFNGSLTTESRLLASLVELEGRRVELELHDADMRGFQVGGDGFLLVRQGSRTLYRSPSLGPDDTLPEPTRDEPSFGWAALEPGPTRWVAFRFTPRRERGPSRADDPVLSIALARDAGPLRATLDTLAALLAVVGAATTLVCGFLVWVIVRRAVRPLERLADDVSALDEARLDTRLDTAGLPREALPLAERVNELLERLQARLARERDFSAEVAHELRTPLAGLRTTLEVLLREDGSQSPLRECLHGAILLQGLVERLLILARLEAERTQPTKVRLDLSELAVETWSLCARDAASRGLQVTWEIEPSVEIDADPQLVGMILRNLLENAVRYADEGGWIRVEASAGPEDLAQLAVTNSGSRLAQEDADQATERFWRGDRARAQVGLHCGLGLSLVAKATAALGGTLRLRSAPGEAFRAELRLPQPTGDPALVPAGSD